MLQHPGIPFVFMALLPFSLSMYLPNSNPLLSFHNQVREVHLYTGTCGSRVQDCVEILNHLIKTLWPHFPSLCVCATQTTTEGRCTCRLRQMGECQEVTCRHFTVSRGEPTVFLCSLHWQVVWLRDWTLWLQVCWSWSPFRRAMWP